MDYIEVTFRIADNAAETADILASMLGEIGFESFAESSNGLIGYCPAPLYDEPTMRDTIAALPFEAAITFRMQLIADQNWNALWEQEGFEPIVVGQRCIIHSSRHEPNGSYDYAIKIDPEQAFGTGSHETTRMIVAYLADMPLTDKQVLDMGCGTAVLAIMAALRGAKNVTAVDIDPWSERNALKNIALNNITNIEVRLGSVEVVVEERYDVILANINRNILLDQIEAYSRILNPKGSLIVCGFYSSDSAMLIAKAAEFGLSPIATREENDWTMIVFGN